MQRSPRGGKPQTDSEYIESRTHGMDAYAAAGMPHEFATQMMLLAGELGITIALRAGEPDQLYRQSAQPKQSSIPHKSGDWGLTKCVISDDPELGRYDNGKPKNAGQTRPKGIELIQHHLTLRSILKRLGDNCEVFGVAGDRFLLLKCKDAPDERTKAAIFRIDMENGVKPEAIKAEHIDVTPVLIRKNSGSESPEAIWGKDGPEWWKPQWGKFPDMLDYRFPIEYILDQGASYQPLNIYAVKDKNQKLVPVTSDMDLLWISNPRPDHPIVIAANKYNDNANVLEVINTFKVDGSGIIAMRAALEAICAVHQDDEGISYLNLDTVTDERLGRIGCATPFEAYVILLINQRFKESVNHLDDLLQHGADNRSPYAPSEIQRVLHIIGGEGILTENGQDLRNFMTQRRGFIETFPIDLHPQLDMTKWQEIVARQKACGQQISKALDDNYIEAALPNTSPLLRRASSGLETLVGKFNRTLSSFSPEVRRKGSMPNTQRKSSLEHYSSLTRSRRASEPMLQTPAPIIRLTKKSEKSHQENSYFLSVNNQHAVKDFCHEKNKNGSAWQWSMPRGGEVQAVCEDKKMRFIISNSSIDLHTENVSQESSEALHDLAKVLCPDMNLSIIATDEAKADYLKWTTPVTLEPKKN